MWDLSVDYKTEQSIKAQEELLDQRAAAVQPSRFQPGNSSTSRSSSPDPAGFSVLPVRTRVGEKTRLESEDWLPRNHLLPPSSRPTLERSRTSKSINNLSLFSRS